MTICWNFLDTALSLHAEQGPEAVTVPAVLARSSAREGVHGVVGAYLRFTRTRPDVERYVHAASGAAPVVTGAGAVALEGLRAWFRPHLTAGALAPLPEQLVEMLLVGPVAETARRWLAGDPTVDLDAAERLLPERVWASLRA